MARAVLLCTDFGPGSAYVGQMKLVLAGRSPASVVVDLAHDIPAQDLAAAALVLSASTRIWPENCVVCAVVDPTVGSPRRIVAGQTEGGAFVLAPDNGLAAVLGPFKALHAVENAELWLSPVSAVFHGRDIFAPVAAHLAAGGSLADVGPAIAQDTLTALPVPLRAPPDETRVLLIDTFGNLVTTLHRDDIPPDLAGVTIGDKNIVFVNHYAAAPPGGLLALVGSYDLLEVAVRNRSAAEALRARVKTPVIVRRSTPPPASQSK